MGIVDLLLCWETFLLNIVTFFTFTGNQLSA